MAKRGSTGTSDSDSQPASPAIAEALRNVHVTTKDDDDSLEGVQATREAEQQAEAEQHAAAAIDTQSLLGQDILGSDNLAGQLGTDPDTGTGLDSAVVGGLGRPLRVPVTAL
jgi:hypothetical protein